MPDSPKGTSAAAAPPSDEVEASKREREIRALQAVPGVGESKAQLLHAAGFRTLADLRNASVEQLAEIKGIGEKLAVRIIQGASAVTTAEESGEDPKALAKWLSGEGGDLTAWLGSEEAGAAAEAAVNHAAGPTDALARWLAGEEESLDAWLSEAAHVEAPPFAGPRDLQVQVEEVERLKQLLKEQLQGAKEGTLDVADALANLASARAAFETERRRRKELEEELEHVKRGSIAVIKYIKAQQGRETLPEDVTDKLAQEMARREQAELQLLEAQAALEGLRSRLLEQAGPLPAEAQEVQRLALQLKEKELALAAREKVFLDREQVLMQRPSEGVGQSPELAAELARVQDVARAREGDLRARLGAAEGRIKGLELELAQLGEAKALAGKSAPQINEAIKAKILEVQQKEKAIGLRESEIVRLKEELQFKTDELSKLKEPMRFKEDELNRRDEDLRYRENLLIEERKQVERLRMELQSTDELTLKKRLEELSAQIQQKEEEIRSKERYLSAKTEELRLREQGLIGKEIESREEERQLELKIEKVKSGTPRLDDLLMGGFPFGTNALVYGPPFTGKEVLVNSFIAEGLRKGVPAIWVITDKTPREIREEMQFILSGYEEYEKRGLVKYIDVYSRSMGDETTDPYTVYIESPTDFEGAVAALEQTAKAYRKEHKYYRLAFRSISTMVAYLDPNTAFKFLSPIVGRRKRDKAVALYTIEKGMHGEQEIQMIGSLMDGLIDLKVDNLNTFLAVKGICDVQSRAWIRYTATKQAVMIGSFSLDHIR